jgi:hypothetical protein
MAVYVYNTFYPFATENFDKDDLVLVFKEYFILDASAIQYLQSH